MAKVFKFLVCIVQAHSLWTSQYRTTGLHQASSAPARGGRGGQHGAGGQCGQLEATELPAFGHTAARCP